MKFRIRDLRTLAICDNRMFIDREGKFYNGVLECIGDHDKYLVEVYLFKDKNQKDIYVNDIVILKKKEYRIKLSATLGIVLEDSEGVIYPLKNKPSDFVKGE